MIKADFDVWMDRKWPVEVEAKQPAAPAKTRKPKPSIKKDACIKAFKSLYPDEIPNSLTKDIKYRVATETKKALGHEPSETTIGRAFKNLRLEQ